MLLQIDFMMLIGQAGSTLAGYGSVNGYIELPSVPQVRDIVDIFGGRRPSKGAFEFDGRLKVITVSATENPKGGLHHFIALDAVLLKTPSAAEGLRCYLEEELGLLVEKAR
jgi:hypothetical protein